MIGGCHWGGQHTRAVETARIDGVSVCEFDGLNARLKWAADAGGLLMVSGGRLVEQVELRVGDGFVITDGRALHRAYQLLAADANRVILKKQELIDRRATREGIRTTESVIAVQPYDLESTGRLPAALE